MARKFDEEFRREAVKLVLEGGVPGRKSGEAGHELFQPSRV